MPSLSPKDRVSCVRLRSRMAAVAVLLASATILTSIPQPATNKDPRALHFDHSCRLLVNGKPL